MKREQSKFKSIAVSLIALFPAVGFVTPATAFWSLTLYDQANGFFIPNEQKKYSVGENAGFKLNAEGGIEIVISAKKPEGVPDENWLPINRADIDLSLMYRIYAPDAEKMKTWKMPQPEIIL
jgi:hypothetical protein